MNPNGGAIALGHPLGCTGAKLTATILRELQRKNARYGMVTMCIGGGIPKEPHHHLVLENSYVRVFRVSIPANDAKIGRASCRERV